MKKRSVTFGEYRSADHGWTVTGITLSAPEQKTNYVEKTGGDGSWDLSTALTGGIPRYKNRTLTVTMENSTGDREAREKIINDLVNALDGLEQQIVLPDRPEHYLTGRVHVAVNYSDMAHAAVTITAACEPWLYKARESLVEIIATGTDGEAYIYNEGRKTVVPLLTVEGNFQLFMGGASVQLEEGVYKWPGLLLSPGLTALNYTGTGTLTITFREAVLR